MAAKAPAWQADLQDEQDRFTHLSSEHARACTVDGAPNTGAVTGHGAGGGGATRGGQRRADRPQGEGR